MNVGKIKKRALRTNTSSLFSRTLYLLVTLSLLLVPFEGIQAQGMAPAATLVGGDITQNTTWTKAGSPYQVTTTITVFEGITLTVEPGVEVQFANNVELRVRGKILAGGTPAAPILFTGMVKTPGSWQGIWIYGTDEAPNTGSIFDYVTIEYGGLASSSDDANLFLTDASAAVSHSTLRYGGSAGIMTWAGGRVDISDTSFVNNAGWAVLLTDQTVDQKLANLTASGNGLDAIGMGRTGDYMEGDHTWEAAGIPYIVLSLLAVSSGSTLTVEPGVEVRFEANRRLTVWGKLFAVGEPETPILFTGVDQTPGSWQGIEILGTGDAQNHGSVLEYVQIEYGGYEQSTRGNLYLQEANAVIRHSTFRSSGAHGIFGWSGGSAEISDSTFEDNLGYAVYLTDETFDLKLSRLSASGNGTDAVAIGGNGTYLSGVNTWERSGLPYVVTRIIGVGSEAELVVEPGVEVRFTDMARLDVYGTLTAMGTPEEPITFTAASQAPGGWQGIVFSGLYDSPAVGNLSYTTVEYGGGGNQYEANIYVANGRVTITHSTIRNSSADGLLFKYYSSRSSVETTRIYGNAAYGIQNTDSYRPNTVLAANNYWGDPSGPQSENTCNPGGKGERISSGVAFLPFLTGSDQDPGPVPASAVYHLQVTPRRWFAPANDTPVYVDIVLTDGRGNPLPGREVKLGTSLGIVTDGGITDAQGHTLAVIRAIQPGTAKLEAYYDTADECYIVRSSIVEMTFTGEDTSSELTPNAEAPYMDSGIQVEPLPIQRGVPTRISAKLNNPNPYPIIVDATFGFAQAGIGLAFGPAGEVRDYVIPANGEGVVEIFWTPVVSGNYCVRLEYSYRPANARMMAPSGRGSGQRNLSVAPAPFLPPNAKNSLKRAKVAGDAVGDGSFLLTLLTSAAEVPGSLLQGLMVGNITGFQMEAGGAIGCALEGGENCGGWSGPSMSLPGASMGNLGSDPPRQDYDVIAVPEKIEYPHEQPGPNMPAARAAALNRLLDASMDLSTKLIAAVVSFDRYAGAVQARDLKWSSVQANNYLFYLNQSAQAMIAYQQAIYALVDEIKAEGYTDMIVTAEDYKAYQDRLRVEGFSDEELRAARIAGMTEEGIQMALERRLAADPNQMAGSQMDRMLDFADELGKLAYQILNPPAFGSVTGSAGLALPVGSQAAENNLARIYNAQTTIEVGNPTDSQATIDLKARSLGLPPDWIVDISPAQVTLNPGEQATVAITLLPGAAVAQNTSYRVAIEGYIGDELLSGVAVDVLVPDDTPPGSTAYVYLPLAQKQP